MKIYNTTRGWLRETDSKFYPLAITGLDEFLSDPDPLAVLDETRQRSETAPPEPHELLAPVGTQEVWASGVTYFRSRNARMEESKDAGGGSFYDRVYTAERPELFFKATGPRVAGPGAPVRIRRDATWSVPEPELTLVVSAAGQIVGYTVGNDMSSRDIEGENPLYLPQAKVYDGSCALGPCILLRREPIPRTTAIHIEISRRSSNAAGTSEASIAFSGDTTLAELKRDPEELKNYLFREMAFPTGAFLLTGTGIVPPDDFTLRSGDTIRITIDGIGQLTNPVA